MDGSVGLRIAAIAVLGWIVSQLWDIVKRAIKEAQERDWESFLNYLGPAVIAQFFSFGAKLPLVNLVLQALQLQTTIPVYGDYFVTGVIMSTGANGVFQFVKGLKDLVTSVTGWISGRTLSDEQIQKLADVVLKNQQSKPQ